MSGEPVDLPDILAEVREVHDKGEAALSRNDLDVLDALFWRDEKTIRFVIPAPEKRIISGFVPERFVKPRSNGLKARVMGSLRAPPKVARLESSFLEKS